jgi:ABC-type polysaccharide/polyol phosphate transport system ATPase subunit
MTAIEVRGVSKTFLVHHERHTTLAERLMGFFRRRAADRRTAVDDVTLEIPDGQFVGIIGANGSGKSTLLKLMAGVLVPDAGEVRVTGRLVPLLELGLGFHQELTVRENVLVYGLVLGYPPGQLVERIAEVIRFAGLEDFQDAKLKSLSSGMLVRLAFATAIRADADILLLDEVMAVGDAQFQLKCIEAFTALKQAGRTIVLVSHDLNAVQRFCDRVFWLDRGRVVMQGDGTDVVQAYLMTMQKIGLEVGSFERGEAAGSRWGDGRLRISRAELEGEDGRPVTRVRAGERLVVRLEATASGPCPQPVLGMIVWLGGQAIYSINSALLGVQMDALEAGDHCAVELSFVAGLINGQYTMTLAATDRNGTAYDWINHVITFLVEGSHCGDGVADLAGEIRCAVTKAASGTARVAPTA